MPHYGIETGHSISAEIIFLLLETKVQGENANTVAGNNPFVYIYLSQFITLRGEMYYILLSGFLLDTCKQG